MWLDMVISEFKSEHLPIQGRMWALDLFHRWFYPFILTKCILGELIHINESDGFWKAEEMMQELVYLWTSESNGLNMVLEVNILID